MIQHDPSVIRLRIMTGIMKMVMIKVQIDKGHEES
jgi:hypothetical protein